MENDDGIYDKIPLLTQKEMKGRKSFTFESKTTLAQLRLEKLMSKKESLIKQIQTQQEKLERPVEKKHKIIMDNEELELYTEFKRQKR